MCVHRLVQVAKYTHTQLITTMHKHNAQAIAMRDGQLSDQEMILQRRMDLSEQREREQTLQLEVLTNNFDAMRANCAQQVCCLF